MVLVKMGLPAGFEGFLRGFCVLSKLCASMCCEDFSGIFAVFWSDWDIIWSYWCILGLVSGARAGEGGFLWL